MSGPGAPQQAGVAPGPPVHLYEAASSQRERVVTGFDAQREAILKAVDDQRRAAMAPIQAAQTRQTQPGAPRPIQAQAAAMNPAPSPAATRQQAVVADIVMTLKAMVAEEVRAQLVALLAAADARQKSLSQETQAGHAG
jgi:hypothetical protein